MTRQPTEKDGAITDEEQLTTEHVEDARRALLYLVVRESAQYVAIMDVLESSVADLTPVEVRSRLEGAGTRLDYDVLEARLDKLREWGAVSARTDTSRILRHADLLARNWRYTATPVGRHVQRFYQKVLAGTPAMREIPLSSLAQVVEAAEALALSQGDATLELIRRLFVNHDDLDSALVGAEDSLASLVDRFDLTDTTTAELKTLLVGYATHVAAELELGSARAFRQLLPLRPRFAALANLAVGASDARALIERGALSASRGGRTDDWEELLGWFDPNAGRAARFTFRLVRALPAMHVNLRRLHSSLGSATSRSRALLLARACTHPRLGTALLLAAIGDHPWRKFHGTADDADSPGIPSWRDGPRVEVPELLRATGRAGARGRSPAARDETDARMAVALSRQRRQEEHARAVQEVLRSGPGHVLSEHAARVALAALTVAVRGRSDAGRRTGVRDGLACTLFDVSSGSGIVRTRVWRVFTPHRVPVFHLPNVRPRHPAESLDEAALPTTARRSVQ